MLFVREGFLYSVIVPDGSVCKLGQFPAGKNLAIIAGKYASNRCRIGRAREKKWCKPGKQAGPALHELPIK
jgi:hypothetical protein